MRTLLINHIIPKIFFSTAAMNFGEVELKHDFFCFKGTSQGFLPPVEKTYKILNPTDNTCGVISNTL